MLIRIVILFFMFIFVFWLRFCSWFRFSYPFRFSYLQFDAKASDKSCGLDDQQGEEQGF